MEQHSSWLPSLLSSLLSAEASHRMENRVTRLEVHKEDQERANFAMHRRVLWIERGLQAVVTVMLTALAVQGPDKAEAIARLLLSLAGR